mgnify:CR=1 FL=1
MVETPPHDPLTEANVQKLEAATMPVRVRSAARDGDEQEADEAAGPRHGALLQPDADQHDRFAVRPQPLGDAAEIARLAEAAHRDARHHVGDELVVGHDAGLRGRGVVDRRDHLDEAIFGADFDAEAAELAAGLHLHVAEALGVHVARMRIEAGQHARDRGFDQLGVVGLDRKSVV